MKVLVHKQTILISTRNTIRWTFFIYHLLQMRQRIISALTALFFSMFMHIFKCVLHEENSRIVDPIAF